MYSVYSVHFVYNLILFESKMKFSRWDRDPKDEEENLSNGTKSLLGSIDTYVFCREIPALDLSPVVL